MWKALGFGAPEKPKRFQENLIDNLTRDELTKAGLSTQEIAVLNDLTDVRGYALTQLNWIRVVENSIEAFHLTSESLRSMTSGLAQAEHPSNNDLFNISICEPHVYYTNVPFSIIQTENPEEFYPYGQRVETYQFAASTWYKLSKIAENPNPEGIERQVAQYIITQIEAA